LTDPRHDLFRLARTPAVVGEGRRAQDAYEIQRRGLEESFRLFNLLNPGLLPCPTMAA
jgi:hypothetical protein